VDQDQRQARKALTLDARGLSKTFRGRQVLQEVDFSASAGELIVIVGRSGCGKSTLLRCLNGLETFDEGSIRFGDRVYPANVRDVRVDFGMVFQSFNLFPHIDLLENLVAAPMIVKGMTRAEAEAVALPLLEKVGLSAHVHHYPIQMSGGQQQRAAIARALAMSPKVMLYDEPTSALDPWLVDEVFEVMRTLDKEGMTQIVVTHETRFAREVARKIVFMEEGRVVETGTPEKIFNNPDDPRTIQYMKKFAACFLLALSSFSASAAPLRWGGDSASGAPFVFQDPQDPARTIGFEADVAEVLAAELGQKTQFVQNQWDSLVPGLKRGDYDVVINGLEITDDRKVEVEFSDPYYLTYEALTVRKNTYDISSLADLKGRKAGTLKGALAERLLAATAGVDVVGYDTQTMLYDDLALGRIDAVLLDHPAAVYYGIDPRLKNLPGQYGRMAYGVALRKGDTQRTAKVNAAIERLIKSGKLREIYERWGIWNPVMAASFIDDRPSHHTEPSAYNAYLEARGVRHGWRAKLYNYLGYIPLLAKGAITTIQLSLLAMVFAIILGLTLALMRLYGPFPARALSSIYVEFIRGSPLLIQLFFIFYGLPTIGIKLSPFTAAVLGLALNYGAYEAEVYRAGIQAIPHAQMEASLALGMTRWQALRHIIIPQAVRVVLPPTTNDFIALLKDSSLVSVITMVELTRVYGQLAAMSYDYMGIGILTAMMYVLIGLPFVRLSRWAEARLAVDRRPQGP
jgi:polar amino acid transport system substrate-binding protein